MPKQFRGTHSVRQLGVKLPAVTLTLFYFASSALLKAELRTWTDGSGKYQTEAEFVECDQGLVHLKRQDGTRITVRLERLCRADQELIKDLEQNADQRESLPSHADDSASLTREYQRLLIECSKLAAAKTDDIVAASVDALQALQQTTQALEKEAARSATLEDDSGVLVFLGDGRFVEQEHLGELYARLGTLRVSLNEALQELHGDFQKSRRKHIAAKHAAQRARYLDSVSRAMALQRAINESRAIRSGTGRVVVGPHKTPAGPLGTARYVSGLWDNVSRPAPSSFIKQRRPATSAISEAKDRREKVEELDNAVTKELKLLEAAWFPEVETIIEGGQIKQCRLALGTFGWWSGRKCARLFERCLSSDDPQLREAAAGAVENFVRNAEDLVKYVSHEQPEARLAAIRFLKKTSAVERLDERQANRLAAIVATATTDEVSEIRRSAYEVLDVLLAESHPWKVAVGPRSLGLGNPRIPSEKLDSHWLNLIEVDEPPKGMEWAVVELFKKEYGQCLIPALQSRRPEVVLDALGQIACRKCKWGAGLAVHFSLGAEIRRLCRSRDDRIRSKALEILPWVDWKAEYAPWK